jgi:hypothetical protein
MVERQLPKLHTGVRFPSPAHLLGEQAKNERNENENNCSELAIDLITGGLYAADPSINRHGQTRGKSNLARRCDERLQGKSDGKDDGENDGERV